MLSAKQLQNAYNKLYTCLRKYIWPVNIVQNIADFEISVYKAFPNLLEIRDNYNRLKVGCLRYIDDDEEMKQAFEDFREKLDSSNDLFAKLNTRVEGAE